MQSGRGLPIFVILTALVASPLVAQGEQPLSTGVTGSTPSDPRRNPVEILGPIEVQRLVLAIAERPHSRVEVEAAITEQFFDLDDMIAVGLLREEDDVLRIDFNLLTVDDQRRILETTESMGRSLATALLERSEELRALAARHGQPRDLAAELLYLVLGCFSLDWDGLDLTQERGWRDVAQRTIDGQSFTPWAKEIGADISLEGLYWGSHNHTAGELTATTFGDHDALPRFGFPDLLWRSGRAFREMEDAEVRRAAAGAVAAYSMEMLLDAGAVMRSLRYRNLTRDEVAESTGIREDKLDPLLALLEAADYVELVNGKLEAAVVVLVSEDALMVDAIRAIGREVMIRWHEENYGGIREALSDLTPGRNDVPFERVYTEIWHFAFGIANRTLVEAGLFADPYAADRRYRGFLPAIWASELAD